jgi:L-alanine-DL-glutamate epimerase-like enolase superfamily enzyme
MLSIKRIEAIAVSLPMAKPMKMAGVEIRSADNVLVRVEASDGSVGWGEAASAPHMTGETVESMVAAVRYLIPALEGRRIDALPAIVEHWTFALYGNHAAKSAIEMALQDLAGKAAGVPAWKLFGAQQRSRMAVLWLIGTGSTDGDVAEARARKAAGFVAYKIKVGTGEPGDDARRSNAVCEVLGAGNLISSDANQGYSVEQALAYVDIVKESRLDFFEQPVRSHDLAGMAKVAAASRVLIGADEGLHGLDDIQRHHDMKAASGASLKTIKLGGMREVFDAGTLCARLGMRVNLANKVAESSIGIAAVLHLAAALPGIDWGLSITNQYLSDDIVARPIRVVEGHAEVPEGVGLGVEVDEAKVARYRTPL